MANQTEFCGLIDGMLAVAGVARGPVTIGVPCASYEQESLRALVENLAARAAEVNVTIRGVCCDASMVGKLGVDRTDIYGGLLHGAPVSLRGPFDVVEFTLLGVQPALPR